MTREATPAEAGADRLVATVLATDLVDSTRLAAEQGDRAFRELLSRHDAAVREEVARRGGREINTTGDGFLAAFDRPEAAIRCALAVRRAVGELGLKVRCGLHTGEVQLTDGKAGGIAVHIGARVVARAAPGEILVSGTVRDLAVGSGLVFRNRGSHALKGVPGSWRLFAVSESDGAAETIRPRRWPPGRIGTRAAALLLAVAALGVWTLLRSDGPRARTDGGPDAAAADSREASIVVLPFANLSGERTNEYFSDGMTEEIISALTSVPRLRVVSRTSAFAFKGRQEDVRSIGEKLDVDFVLEGSVRTDDDRLRVTAQMVEAASGYHVWSETYERERRDVFAIQDEISRAIVRRLELDLASATGTGGAAGGGTPGVGPADGADGRTSGGGAADGPRLVGRPTEDLEAYNLFLEGRFFWNQRTAEGMQRAIGLFQQAAQRDSTFALAQVGLADCYSLLGLGGALPPEEAFRRAGDAARRAIEQEPGLGEAHASLGFVQTNLRDWDGAGRSYRRALELKPGYATARHLYAVYLATLGRLEEALGEIRRAQQLDPLAPVIHVAHAELLTYARRYPDAARQALHALDLNPDFPYAHTVLGNVYAQLDSLERAAGELRRSLELTGGGLWRDHALGGLGYVHARAGRRGEAAAVLADLELRSRTGRIEPFAPALVEVGLGRVDAAFGWLDQVVERPGVVTALRWDPRLEPLRGDPRFDELLKRVGLSAS
jgi:TolB-like protein/class 3 adenylate cyclase/Flp pilus assembly protein TadD